jgi:hypothetical protein
MGAWYEAKADSAGAAREFREAARLDPKRYGELLKKYPPDE